MHLLTIEISISLRVPNLAPLDIEPCDNKETEVFDDWGVTLPVPHNPTSHGYKATILPPKKK